ncbi:MAG: hypothetical protein ABRQ25_14420 [Clostridiaceae bacterium]
MNNKKIQGYIMVGIGFTVLIINALSYLFNWDIGEPAFTVLGLISVVVGVKLVRM